MEIKLGLGSLLTIVFTVLKLCGALDWSWWWVTCPLWIPLLLAVICIVVIKALED